MQYTLRMSILNSQYNVYCVEFYIKNNTLWLPVLSLQAFEAGRDSLPDWLLFDNIRATFSGVPMEKDAGNTFIEVNMLDNGQLILDEVFSIEVRPADALMFTRKLSKSFLQKITHSGLSNEVPQQQSTEHNYIRAERLCATIALFTIPLSSSKQ